jgi:DNA-damage-inducible protein D
MKSENEISNEHITNNKSVRKTLLERWVKPEELQPVEDLKKVERKLNTNVKKWLYTRWFKNKK